MNAMAGSPTGFDIESIREEDCEFVTSPVVGADLAIPVYGDSMTPDYPSGSRVIVKIKALNAWR